MFFYDALVRRHQALLSLENCFPEFGTVSDGTPGKAAIEAVRQVRVTRTGHTLCALVYFQLHDKSVNGMEHAHHLIVSIKSKKDGPDSNPKDWKAATRDSCATNDAAVDHIHRKTAYTCYKNCCNSHTLYLLGSNFDTPTLKLFKKR